MKKRSAKLLYSASEVEANLLYATRFFAPDPFFWIAFKGKTYGFFSDLEVDRARQTAQIDHPLSLSQLEKEIKLKTSENRSTQAIISFLKNKKINHLFVPYTFPHGLADLLQKNRFTIETISDESFFPARRTKTQQEIAALQYAQRLAEFGMTRAKEILLQAKPLKNGCLQWRPRQLLTSETLQAEINMALAYAGGHAAQTIVAGGQQSCDPHERGSGPLKANQFIIVDIFPRVIRSGYWGDITRTFIRGQASEAQHRLYHTVFQAQKRALKQLKPHCDGKKIQQDVRDYFLQQGYSTEIKKGRHTGFFHGLGHGVGLEIHEAPRFSSGKLKMGDVITVEPGLYYPEIGGVRIEDLVVITSKGYQNLTRFPKNFVL